MSPSRLRMSDYDYHLPPELIAQEPLQDRSASRLMVVHRASNTIDHRRFLDLPDLLSSGDLIVVNDSRVLPARLIGQRETGGAVEILLLRELQHRHWSCLMRPARRLQAGEEIRFPARNNGDLPPGRGWILSKEQEGKGTIELDAGMAAHLAAYGRVPLPPYITRALEDDSRYQTVYAQEAGSAAAPTAGLHLTPEVFTSLSERSIGSAMVTLHVGLDTFRPVTSEYADQHQIHQEWCAVPAATARAIFETRWRGGRIVAVGTTPARTLETYALTPEFRSGAPFTGMTGIYITPGHQWKLVDAMVTNFHLPKSTLLLMMSALVGKELLFEAYREAIAQRYRFFSFGDAMLVL